MVVVRDMFRFVLEKIVLATVWLGEGGSSFKVERAGRRPCSHPGKKK